MERFSLGMASRKKLRSRSFQSLPLNCSPRRTDDDKERYWRIQGHDGFDTIFEGKAELGQFTDHQIRHLLQALTATAGRSFDEIVGVYAKRRTTISNGLLAVY
jgi:hypothetical protein